MSHAVSFAAEDFTEGFQVHDCLLWMCGDSVLDCLKLEFLWICVGNYYPFVSGVEPFLLQSYRPHTDGIF